VAPPAEGQVGGFPGHISGAVGSEDRTTDVVGAHRVELAVLEDRHDNAIVPHLAVSL